MSSLGGALLGLALGTAGLLSRQEPVPLLVIVGAWFISLWMAVTRPDKRLGTSRQVKRSWSASPVRVHAIWGVTLGFALLTAIPYSSWLLVFAAEIVGGPSAGAASGALLGLGRQIPILIAPFTGLSPGQVVGLVDDWAKGAQFANLLLVLIGGGCLVLFLG